MPRDDQPDAAPRRLDERLLAAVEPIAERAARDTRHRIFSDVSDDAGLQYVDLCLDGGGGLGIALLGYVAVLERCGLRFLGLAGASSGALTACLLAALDEPAAAKAAGLARVLASLPQGALADGPPAAHQFLAALRARAGWPRVLVRGLGARGLLERQLGLHPGDAFLAWLHDALVDLGVVSAADLRQRMLRRPPGLHHGPTAEPVHFEDEPPELKLFACDASTGTRVELPAMASLYWERPAELSPALFVRAALSLPPVLRPVSGFRPPDPRPAPVSEARPRRFVLVDGGVLQGLPIDAFHRFDRVPRRPTFGVTLRGDARRREIHGPVDLLDRTLTASRQVLDDECLRRHPDYRYLVGFVDAGAHDWLEFDPSEDAQADLVERGARAAEQFLARFDWLHYKRVRAALAEAYA